MYLEHFGLVTNPFALSPRLNFLYRTNPFEESMAHLVYGIENNEAIIMITGAIGTGKTMAIQSFLSRLSDDFVFALVTNTRVDSKELLKLILEDLGLELAPGMDKSDLLIMFKDFLIRSSREGKRVLVVVDEAQNLDRDALEEIRLLTNLGQGEGQPVQVVLMGQPELLEVLNRDDLAQLRQRIRVHYHLDHLTAKEVRGYIEHRMQVAGGEAGVFSSGACERIHELSGGVPRVVNTLAGDALLAAFVDGRSRVEARDVNPTRVSSVPGEITVEKFAVPERRDSSPATDAGPVSPSRETTASSESIERNTPSEPIEDGPTPARKPQHSSRRPPRRAVRTRSARRRWVWVLALAAVALIVMAAWYAGFLNFIPSPLSERFATAPGMASGSADTGHVTAVQEPSEIPVAVAPADSYAIGNQENDLDGKTLAGGGQPTAENTAGQQDGDLTVLDLHYIRTDSFRTVGRAERAVSAWEQEGYTSFYRPTVVRGTTWYRVYLGPFATRAQALREANRLKELGRISYFVVTKLETN